VLGQLTAAAHVRSQADPVALATLRRNAELRLAAHPPPSLAAALRRPDVAVIAELKRRSPSKGVLDDSLDAGAVASAFAAGGAAAMSVLTEPSAFGGALADLESASRRVRIPLLRKDFIVSSSQVFEAASAGASAVLLIARALGPVALVELAEVAQTTGLETLIEVRSEAELAWAVEAGADVIGVNSRNLETLEIDPAVATRLVPMVPAETPAVFESGIRTRDDVEQAARAGADAVLVGSVLSAQGSSAEAVRGLVGVPRRPRG
jgi:indole-3-glycerol phosphate synthase